MGTMGAVELYKQDGSTAGIFYCSQCRIVYRTKEDAEWCHGDKLCGCGKKIESIYSRQSKCRDCDSLELKEKERKREAERFEAAIKIKAADYSGEHVYCGDSYYDSVEDAIDQFLEGQEPDYIWACKDNSLPTVDLEDVTCNLLDNMWEDADTSDLNGIDELEAALTAFNEANKSVLVWGPDYSTAILVNRIAAPAGIQSA
jgi:hypothetical protein